MLSRELQRIIFNHTSGRIQQNFGGSFLTNQDKIKYLRGYRNNEREIERLREEIVQAKALSKKVTVSFDGVGGSNGEDKLQVAVERIISLQNGLTAQVIRRVNLRKGIECAIQTVDDERLQQLLKYRYINGLTWESIAVCMHYSWQHLHKLHRKALDAIECDC